MSTSDEVQKRNAFAACAAFRIDGLEASLDRAREIAFQGELDAVGLHTAFTARTNLFSQTRTRRLVLWGGSRRGWARSA
jgi:hypothetical protein